MCLRERRDRCRPVTLGELRSLYEAASRGTFRSRAWAWVLRTSQPARGLATSYLTEGLQLGEKVSIRWDSSSARAYLAAMAIRHGNVGMARQQWWKPTSLTSTPSSRFDLE
jgi:hypothetical protein